MKEKMFRRARIALTAAVAFGACPGYDIALVTASLAQSHSNAPHEAVLDQRKIQVKAPPIRVSRLPRR